MDDAPSYNFPTFYRGDSRRLAFIAKRRALFSGQISLLPLAGARITWTVRRPGQPDLVKSTDAGGGLTLDAVRSRVEWPISPTESQSLSAGANPYRVRATFLDGEVETLLSGTITTVE